MYETRIRLLNGADSGPGPVIYWMSRDQRARDNWGLLHAQEIALTRKVPLAVIFNIVPNFLEATWRQYHFMLQGLQETAANLTRLSIPFFVLQGNPEDTVPQFIDEHKASTLIGDFNPLRIAKIWQTAIKRKISIPFLEVDTHNIVPCRFASDKREFGAYTLRPKIHKLLSSFLTDIPELLEHPYRWPRPATTIDWQEMANNLKINRTIQPTKFIPGSQAAETILHNFIEQKLNRYTAGRNDPTQDNQSNLSPYLHFGQISSQRIAFTVKNSPLPDDSKASFLEELIVRKELADNFCLHTDQYDQFEGFPAWAQQTLNEHRTDQRQFIYSSDQFEQAHTHDLLWNAAQLEMVQSGKMHGFMRMYWAKKILEWSKTPEDALAIAIQLNDRYELDGRDPNGYTGIAWSIGGVHDRAWFPHPVYGKIRYMNANGCQRKFDTARYISQWYK